MVDVQSRPARTPDRASRSAALWATVVAVPVAVVVGLLVFWRLAPTDAVPAAPTPSGPVAVPAAPVQMAAPGLSGRAAQVCRTLTAQLPAALRDLPARKVSAGPEQNAAYGEPPITLACGVPRPTMCERVDGGRPGCVPLDAVMMRMNGVCWYAQDGPATDVFTTMDREVAARVTVPSSYEQTAQWANEFSDAVARSAKPDTTGLPSGCR